jgi:hypothetical protein
MAKLRIQRCKMGKTKIEPVRGDDNVFEALINPESYSHDFGLRYTGTTGRGSGPIGSSAPVPKYAMAEAEKMSFSIVLDGTGVVEDARERTVAEQVETLRRIVYDYDGDEHEPTAVKIMWGKGIKAFFGRLSSMSMSYTLFHPAGDALRAKVSMDFIEARTEAQEALEAKRRSPDLTHVVQVLEGDTLPLLCHRIYKDAGKYLEIAALNQLDNFRSLVPGTLLRFPPMR